MAELKAKLPPDFLFDESGDLIVPIGAIQKEWFSSLARALLAAAPLVELDPTKGIKDNSGWIAYHTRKLQQALKAQQALEMEMDDGGP